MKLGLFLNRRGDLLKRASDSLVADSVPLAIHNMLLLQPGSPFAQTQVATHSVFLGTGGLLMNYTDSLVLVAYRVPLAVHSMLILQPGSPFAQTQVATHTLFVLVGVVC